MVEPATWHSAQVSLFAVQWSLRIDSAQNLQVLAASPLGSPVISRGSLFTHADRPRPSRWGCMCPVWTPGKAWVCVQGPACLMVCGEVGRIFPLLLRQAEGSREPTGGDSGLLLLP